MPHHLPRQLTRPPALVGRVLKSTPLASTGVLLELDLSRGLLEAPPAGPVEALRARHKPALHTVVEALEKAMDDRRVKGLVVHVGVWQPTLAQSAELREAIGRLREAGKRTVAWSESYGEMAPGNLGYHLASACEEVWLLPVGDLGLVGLSAQSVFVREALDKLGVEPQLSQRHEYKTAADMFTTRSMSEPHREMITRIVESATDTLVRDVARSRGLAEDDVRAALQRGPLTADQALGAGLVDRLGYRDQVYAATKQALGDAGLRYVERYGRPRPSLPSRPGTPTVAVVHATGPIHLGRSGGSPLAGRSVGSDTLGAALRAAGRDDSVRAVVLRVDSPGGSGVASDAIWREVHALRESGTPVVASMGSVAASGGYYIAMPADRVLASPGTITGSIGVLAGKQVLRDALERIGVHRESVSGGRYAEMFSTDRGFDDDEWQRLEAWLDRVYADFTAKAAEDRGMPVEDLRAVARGRVWTGADAHERGLVDELGGLSRAADVACELAEVTRRDAHVRTYPKVGLAQRLVPAENSEAPAAARAALLGLGEGGPLLTRLAAAAGLSPYGVLSMSPEIRLV